MRVPLSLPLLCSALLWLLLATCGCASSAPPPARSSFSWFPANDTQCTSTARSSELTTYVINQPPTAACTVARTDNRAWYYTSQYTPLASGAVMLNITIWQQLLYGTNCRFEQALNATQLNHFWVAMPSAATSISCVKGRASERSGEDYRELDLYYSIVFASGGGGGGSGSGGDSGGVSTTVMVVGAIAGLLLLGAIGAGVYFYLRKRQEAAAALDGSDAASSDAYTRVA